MSLLAASELAQRLVRYDREVAAAVLRTAKRELDADDSTSKSTREWKHGLEHAERLRALCEALALELRER